MALKFAICCRLVQRSRRANAEYAVIECVQAHLSPYWFLARVRIVSVYAVSGSNRHRIRSRYESDGTIPGTILYPLAFSCWNATDRQRVKMGKVSLEDPVALECLEAWVDSEQSDYVKGALHYFKPRLVKKPSKFGKQLVRIGQHDFHSPVKFTASSV